MGTPGLNETRRLLNESTELLAKLSSQAIATGNLDSAERLADEALRYDPQDEVAQGVKKQVAKLREAAAGLRQSNDSLLKVNEELVKYKTGVEAQGDAEVLMTLSKSLKAEKQKTETLKQENAELREQLQQLKSAGSKN